jgi:hypothetical protein
MLRQLQQDFQRHVLGADSAIAAAIVNAQPLPVAERLAIYGNAYRVRMVEALNDTYPTLHTVLGDDMFVELGEAFLETRPSVHRSIRWYGRELATFLAQHPPYSEQPILSEIAQFDWALSEVFDAADAAPLDRSTLQGIDPDAWTELKFSFHPSLRRLTLAWNTVDAWRHLSRDEAPPQPELSDLVPWLLWRHNLLNYFRSLDPIESAALDAAQLGHSFGEICAGLRAWLPEAEIPPRAAGFIGSWTDSGIITSVG